MKHTCHWPSCKKAVPPRMWGCKSHWFELPKSIRDAIWKHYVPGQEKTKNPSPEYLRIADIAQRWCRAYDELDTVPDGLAIELSKQGMLDTQIIEAEL